MFQSRNTPIHLILNILRQWAGHSTHIHLRGLISLRFNEHLMSVLIRELNDFIFNRRTVSRTCSLNRPWKERWTVQIASDDLMRPFICIGQPAGSLVNLNTFRVCRKGKRHNPFIPLLLFHFCKINGIFINPGRCSRLKPIHSDPQCFQTVSQVICTLQPVRPCMRAYFAVNAASLQICACA